MAITPAYQLVNPHFMLPEHVLQYNQVSGFARLFQGGKIQPRLGSGDQYAYVRRIGMRTKTALGQSASNQLPSVSIDTGIGSIPTYLAQIRVEYNHHDQAAAGNWGFGLPEAYTLGARQGIFQQLRSMALYGANPANGEGLLNSIGATSTLLPADTNGHTTVSTYDNGQMLIFILGQIAALKQATLQSGMPSKIVILAPQRVLNTWAYPGIVQLTSYQREGGGTQSIAAAIMAQASYNGDEVEFSFDDTLIGKGAGGTDAIIITCPELKKPEGQEFSTGEFNKLSTGNNAVNLMLSDMSAPRELAVPIPGGALDVLYELRATPGWNIRPEGIRIVSASF
jgi:hypothetical protein